MWVPRSAIDILAALPDAEETHYVDYKATLPAAKKDNWEVAKDVCAMSPDGGVLIYGVGEDKTAGVFFPSPIELTGQSERIDNIVRTLLGGGLSFEVLALEDPDPSNAGKGYIVVHVPASPLAPHVVEGHGAWGRSDKSNKPLSQGELDRLVSRRADWERSAGSRLEEARSACSFEPYSEETTGVVHLIVSPLLSDEGLRSRLGIVDGRNLMPRIFEIVNGLEFSRNEPFSVSQLATCWTKPTREGFRLVHSGNERWELVQLELADNGTVWFDHGGVVWVNTQTSTKFLVDGALATMVAHILASAGRIYRDAAYYGPVDIALVIDGASGALSYDWTTPGISMPATTLRPAYPSTEPVEKLRCLARELAADQVVATTELFLGRMLRSVRMPGWRTPLTVVGNRLNV